MIIEICKGQRQLDPSVLECIKGKLVPPDGVGLNTIFDELAAIVKRPENSNRQWSRHGSQSRKGHPLEISEGLKGLRS